MIVGESCELSLTHFGDKDCFFECPEPLPGVRFELKEGWKKTKMGGTMVYVVTVDEHVWGGGDLKIYLTRDTVNTDWQVPTYTVRLTTSLHPVTYIMIFAGYNT